MMLQKYKSEYGDVISDTISSKPMKGGNAKIVLKDNQNIRPIKVAVPRATPIHWKDMGNTLINGLIQKNILKRVNQVTDWISPGFFVMKPCGKKLRLVTDYKRLNQMVKRPIHPFPTWILTFSN